MTRRSEAPEPLRFRSILLPLDSSPFAEQAIPWAAAIARKARARLRLALVHQPPFPPPLDESNVRFYTRIELAVRKAERDYVRRAAARIREGGDIQLTTATLTGSPAPALADYVREIGADLVVMTTHGRGGVERMWLGSVADQLVRTLDVPVLLVRPKEGESASRVPALEEILVPLDGSRRAEAALAPALGMAKLFGARVDLVQVVEPVALLLDAPVIPQSLDEELMALQRREAKDYLDDIADQISGQGMVGRASSVLAGNALAGIQGAAAAPGVGMIALATHGRGGLRRLAVGSVTDKLVRTGDLPVLVTRPRRK
jgi:nucleotide-binding universal stress UspA family protein